MLPDHLKAETEVDFNSTHASLLHEAEFTVQMKNVIN